MQRPEPDRDARPLLLGLVLALEVVAFGLHGGAFVSGANFAELGRRAAELALPALAVTAVVRGGGVDLSVGGVAALTAALLGASTRSGGLPLPAAALLAVVAAGLAGAINAAAVARLKLSPLLVTLATGWILRGLAQVITARAGRGPLPPALHALGRQDVLWQKVPPQLLLLAAVAALYAWLLRRTRAPALFYPLGAVVTALGALAEVARTGQTAGRPGDALEALALLTAVIGGASLGGGRGSVAGTLLAALVMASLVNALELATLPSAAGLVLAALAALVCAWSRQAAERRRR